MHLLAQMVASGFAWGQDAGGKHVFCAPPVLKAPGMMSAFERFLQDNPDMAERTYGCRAAPKRLLLNPRARASLAFRRGGPIGYP